MNKEVKEVERQAKVGEWVKVVNPDGTHYDEYKKGDILQIVEYKGSSGTADEWRAYYKNEFCKYLNRREYVVLENYNPTTLKAICNLLRQRTKTRKSND